MAKPATKSTALWVLRRLRSAGFEALLAGGCVRDMLLGLRSSDYDIATDATPQQVKRLFGRVLLIGAKFGVAMVIHKGRKVEVATFRSDLSYSDGRRPVGVRFSTPREDALRRDFTINGMFYDPLADRVIDYVNGRKDLQAGVIKTIGKADRRFAEDYLRMIRAVRFAVRMDFSITPATAAAIRKNAARISRISGERIFDELSKMLSEPSAARSLELLVGLSLARAVLGELFEREGLWEEALALVRAVAPEKDLAVTLAALLGRLPQKTISAVIRRWGASNELRDAICWISQHMDGWRTAADVSLAEFKRLLANRNFRRLKRLWLAEERRLSGSDGQNRRIARRAGAIDPGQVCPKPFVNGADLKKLGLAESRRLGQVLRALYEAQLNEQITTRRSALAAARRMIGK